MSFAYNLKYIKDELGATNYQLAKWFGCSQSSLINWLDGGVMPHTKTRQKIADYFGISLAELDGDERPVLPQNWKKKQPAKIGGLDIPDGLSEDKLWIINRILNCDEREAKRIKSVYTAMMDE